MQLWLSLGYKEGVMRKLFWTAVLFCLLFVGAFGYGYAALSGGNWKLFSYPPGSLAAAGLLALCVGAGFEWYDRWGYSDTSNRNICLVTAYLLLAPIAWFQISRLLAWSGYDDFASAFYLMRFWQDGVVISTIVVATVVENYRLRRQQDPFQGLPGIDP